MFGSKFTGTSGDELLTSSVRINKIIPAALPIRYRNGLEYQPNNLIPIY